MSSNLVLNIAGADKRGKGPIFWSESRFSARRLVAFELEQMCADSDLMAVVSDFSAVFEMRIEIDCSDDSKLRIAGKPRPC